MSAEKKKKYRKAMSKFGRGSWREKVDPTFMAWWSSEKRNRALDKIQDPNELKQKFDDWMRGAASLSRAINEARRQIKDPVGGMLLAEIARGRDTEGPDIVLPSGSGQEGGVYAENPESSSFFRLLVFLKYGITFRELIWQIDIERRAAAHRKLMAVHRDYWKMMSVGPVDLKLKFNWEHFSVITGGLDFGLDRLTAEELADCLDEICPCGQRHSPEYFKKVRTAIKQACNSYRKHLLPS